MYEIRQARYEDIPRIMEFIRKYWSPNHIMGNDRTMFEFQHVNKEEVYYILCENVETKELYGTLGYIPMSKWEWPIFSATMIRSIKNSECELPGEEMSKFLVMNKKCYNLISPGIEKRYGSVVRKMGGIVEKMNHYYRLNSRIKEYKIPIIKNRIIPSANGRANLRKLFSNEDFREIFSDEDLRKVLPMRDHAYMQHRFFEHPYYRYRFFQVGDLPFVLIGREVKANGGKAFRIMDACGYSGYLVGIDTALDELMYKNNYEYIDFYCYGIKDEFLEKAGFVKKVVSDGNVIPDHFEPFERKNVDIYFYALHSKWLRVFKGMGDQDRPNAIKLRDNNPDFGL